MIIDGWIYCPICNKKTRTKIRNDTEAKNFPIFCPKCKNTTVMDIYKNKIKRMQSIDECQTQDAEPTRLQ